MATTESTAANDVTYAQTIAWITRAMVAKGYWWYERPSTPSAGVPSGAHPWRRAHLLYYVGRLLIARRQGLERQARGWFARAPWAALDSYWGVDGLLDGQPAGGFVE
ncbi:MAG: hypothetical protein U0232_20850 [Thermomicrobiales bacterium]